MAGLHARERNGVLWDQGATNVTDAKRIRNPAKPGFVKHEAKKNPPSSSKSSRSTAEWATSLATFFCGAAKRVKEALKMGRHVVVSFRHRQEVGTGLQASSDFWPDASGTEKSRS